MGKFHRYAGKMELYKTNLAPFTNLLNKTNGKNNSYLLLIFYYKHYQTYRSAE